MGSYTPGDVLLARIRLRGGEDWKTRPVLVIQTGQEGLQVCPVSSRAPSDAPFITLAPGDFREGGLDICDESYILTSVSFQIRPSEVIGKKGRVEIEVLESVCQLHSRIN